MSHYLDYIIIGFLIIGFLLGFKDGLLKKILSLLGFIVAIIAAIYLSPKVRPFFIDALNFSPKTSLYVSIILIFLLFFILSKIVVKLFKPQNSVLGFIDRLIGGIIGIFQLGLFLSALLIILNFFEYPTQEEKKQIKYYSLVYNLIPSTFKFVERISPESKIVFDLLNQFQKLLKK